LTHNEAKVPGCSSTLPFPSLPFPSLSFPSLPFGRLRAGSAQGKLGSEQAQLSPSTLRLRSGQAQLRMTVELLIGFGDKEALRPFDCAQSRLRVTIV